MNAPSDDHGLTEADCAACQQILAERCARWAANLERMKRAGFDLPQHAADNAANQTYAQGILREYFPGRGIPGQSNV